MPALIPLMSRRHLFACCALALVGGCTRPDTPAIESSASASARSSQQTGGQPATLADSVRRFAQSFYDWYAALANAPIQRYAIDSALRVRPEAFDTVLARELIEDAQAQERAPAGDLVRINFDPVLNSQDPCPHYEVGVVDASRLPYHAPVRGTCTDGTPWARSFVAEIAPFGSTFRFVNFRYDSTDLRKVLKDLRAQRDTTAR